MKIFIRTVILINFTILLLCLGCKTTEEPKQQWTGRLSTGGFGGPSFVCTLEDHRVLFFKSNNGHDSTRRVRIDPEKFKKLTELWEGAARNKHNLVTDYSVADGTSVSITWWNEGATIKHRLRIKTVDQLLNSDLKQLIEELNRFAPKGFGIY